MAQEPPWPRVMRTLWDLAGMERNTAYHPADLLTRPWWARVFLAPVSAWLAYECWRQAPGATYWDVLQVAGYAGWWTLRGRAPEEEPPRP